jgi:hypothetical protein
MKRCVRWLRAAAAIPLLLVGCAPEEGAEGARAALSSVPPTSDGRSIIEDRHVYADPDEGWIEFDMNPGGCAPAEYCIRELEGRARIRIHYSRERNFVDVYADYTDGALPYRPTYEKSFDDSTRFNPQFMRVEDARWQLWLVGELAGPSEELAYYDLATLQFIGTQYDFEPYTDVPFPAEGTYTTLSIPATRMLCTPIFEGNEDGEGHFRFRFRFDRMEDALGSPGTINLQLPFDLCHPDELTNYWTQTRLPDSAFLSFDDFLSSIHNGRGIVVAQSAEPYPKPEVLGYRDNTFLAWANQYPQALPRGLTAQFGVVTEDPGVNGQNPPFPPGVIDLCSTEAP